MKKLITIVVLLLTANTFSQFYKTYDWKENPQIHTLTKSENEESSIGILRKRIIEFKQSKITGDVSVYKTTHTIIRVNDDTGIARHNQVYIPMYGVKKIKSIKARTISKNGKVINLDENNIKKVENVEEYGDFQIFAIEGAEDGSEIEVLYTVEKNYSPFGTETIQYNYPIKRSEMVFITNSLTGYTKVYNNEAKFERTYIDALLVDELVLENIPASIKEEYATDEANRMYVVYQCFGNATLTQDDLWNRTIGNIGARFFPEKIEKTALEIVKKEILKDQPSNLSEYTKASLIDNYVKSNFTVVDNRNEQLEDIDYILANKSANEFSITKAYVQFLEAMEIEYQIVITANRFKHKFKTDFYNPSALQEFLIYLPSIKQYISPTRIDYRLSEAPANILGNNGIFIKKNLEYYFAKITQYDPNYSQIKRSMNIHFSDDFDKVIINENQEYSGHWGVLYRALMTFYTGQDRVDMEDQLTGSGIEDKNITKFEIENTDMNQTEYNKPFVVNSTIESSALLEEAGDSYIFQLGKIIGIQSELYQEKERVHPIEMQFPNQYNYSITVAIPKGYTLEGLESLQIHKKMVVDGKKLCKWDSDYKIEGNKLIITVEESYYVNEFPKEHYAEFRQVINAASDFNKAAIVFSAE